MNHHPALSPLHTGPARLIAVFVLLTGLVGAVGAQISAPPQAPSATVAPQSAKPAWKELSPEQQQALKPLAPHWETLNADRKRKWLAISKNYATLPPAEQAKLHSRMREWASLSPQQRNQARLNFTETKRLAPEEKAAQWQAYQDLSTEEKRRLAAKVPAKPVGVAAVKPVPPEKLAHVPVTRRTRQENDAAPAARAIHRNTLLPRAPAPAPAVPPVPPAVEPAPESSPAPATNN
jgi:hypothetical protein